MPTTTKSSKKPNLPEFETIELRYVPVREVVLFEKNVKKHDLGAISESIQRYGMRSPAIWDSQLNDGAGGIVAGNGRTEALDQMERQGQALPRGIKLDEQGQWCMPIVFGCDAPSEHEAWAYSIDDNGLTLAGGDLSHWDMSKVFDQASFLSLLGDIGEFEVTPISFDAEAIGALLSGIEADMEETLEFQEQNESGNSGKKLHTCPSCGHEFED